LRSPRFAWDAQSVNPRIVDRENVFVLAKRAEKSSHPIIIVVELLKQRRMDIEPGKCARELVPEEARRSRNGRV
jgi:hypothetical protein